MTQQLNTVKTRENNTTIIAQERTIQCNISQPCTQQSLSGHKTTQCSTTQHKATQHSAAQHSAA